MPPSPPAATSTPRTRATKPPGSPRRSAIKPGAGTSTSSSTRTATRPTYYYHVPETNYYGADNKTTGVEYDRGGYLADIQYGLRDENGSIYAPSADKNAPEQVLFAATQRCITASTTICTAANSTRRTPPTGRTHRRTRQCASGATCNNHAPTFWSTMRIDQDHHAVLQRHRLHHRRHLRPRAELPASGDPELELNTITRTGYTASGATLPLQPVNLTYQILDNRVPGYNSEPAMAHWRILDIETETAVISVVFLHQVQLSHYPVLVHHYSDK